MPDSKTYILDDLPTDQDPLDFTPYFETLVVFVKHLYVAVLIKVIL